MWEGQSGARGALSLPDDILRSARGVPCACLGNVKHVINSVAETFLKQ